MLISLKCDQVTILDRNTCQTYNVSYLIIQRYLIFSPIYHLGFNNGHGFIGYPEGRNVERALGPSCPVFCVFLTHWDCIICMGIHKTQGQLGPSGLSTFRPLGCPIKPWPFNNSDLKQLARFFLICLFVHDIFSSDFFRARIFFWYLPNTPPPPQKFNGPSLTSNNSCVCKTFRNFYIVLFSLHKFKLNGNQLSQYHMCNSVIITCKMPKAIK